MPTLTLGTASQATGCAKSTILRAIKSGRISATRAETGEWSIDPAELFRVFPALAVPGATPQPAQTERDATPAERDATTDALVAELRVTIAQLRRDWDYWRSSLDQERTAHSETRAAHAATQAAHATTQASFERLLLPPPTTPIERDATPAERDATPAAESVAVGERQTSANLEEAFWQGLKEIAAGAAVSETPRNRSWWPWRRAG
jgi:hypothetical protein